MNIIVGQSGGPTSTINATLAGVFQAAQRRKTGRIYGMRNGIAGLLEGRTVELPSVVQSDLDLELLKRTPSSFLGSCRFKLPDAAQDDSHHRAIFRRLEQLGIEGFFYIGGNDSMDTIMKLSRYGAAIHSPIRFIGVPKTIDNDLMETDHTPGYGSAAKYIAVTLKELIRDATVYGTNYVTIVEIMGRNAGWLTAAAALAKGEDCPGVDMICTPEQVFDVDRFIAHVAQLQQQSPSVVVAVSEGIRLADGRYVCELSDDMRQVDAFGHTSLTGTARYLSNCVAAALKTKTRCIELSTLQRCAGHLTSRTDITESYQVGGAAVKAAEEGHSGLMVSLERLSDNPYQCATGLKDVGHIANLEKKLPASWIQQDSFDVTDAFLQYARPLIQAELPPFYIDGLVRHLSL